MTGDAADLMGAEAPARWPGSRARPGRRRGDAYREADFLYVLGLTTGRRRDLARAEAAFERSVAIKRELGRDDESYLVLPYLALIAIGRSDLEPARRLLAEAVRLARRFGHRSAYALLDVFACLALREGHTRHSLQLGGAAMAAIDRSELSNTEVWTSIVDVYYKKARAEVGPEAVAVWAAGYGMDYWDAVDGALS